MNGFNPQTSIEVVLDTLIMFGSWMIADYYAANYLNSTTFRSQIIVFVIVYPILFVIKNVIKVIILANRQRKGK